MSLAKMISEDLVVVINIDAVHYLGVSLDCDKAILKICVFDRPTAVVGS